MAITVTVSSGDELREIRARATDTKIIGRIVGRTLESVSQRAFRDQRLGEIQWPERYPNQEDPFVNIAALVNWTNEGGSISTRFFDRRPALVGTGDLRQSISSEVSGGSVAVGSALPYAGLHQSGGLSSQPVTQAAKEKIAQFIGEEPDGMGGWRTKKRMGARQKANREKYWFKLFPLLSSDEITTQVNARPFLGITPEAERDMAEGIEAWVAKGGG